MFRQHATTPHQERNLLLFRLVKVARATIAKAVQHATQIQAQAMHSLSLQVRAAQATMDRVEGFVLPIVVPVMRSMLEQEAVHLVMVNLEAYVSRIKS